MKPFPFISLIVSLFVLWSFSTSAQTRGISKVELQIPNGERIQLYSQSHALVIGVSEYQDIAWGELDSVPRDVREVKKALEGQGFNVETILNPTKKDMDDRIEQFIGDYGYEQNNRLLFYYSGHGYTQERKGRQFGYLVPSDAPNPLSDEKGFFRKSLKMTRVLSWAKEIESKHALFVFDSCFSGSVLRSRALNVPEDISYSTSKPVRQFISAGSANQPVPAESVFRPLFIRGINGKADLDGDGYVTGVELGIYLQKKVPTYESGQTPQYGKIRDPYLDEGNFVFLVPDRKTFSSSGKKKVVEKLIGKRRGILWRVTPRSKWEEGGKKWFQSGDEKTQGKYEGEIVDGVPNGLGVLTWFDGQKYVGEWKDGDFNGQGTYTFADGENYVGEHKDGKRNGHGRITDRNGNSFYGRFEVGKAWSGLAFNKKGNIIGRITDGVYVDEKPVVVIEKSQIGVLYERLEDGAWGWFKNGNEKTDRKYVGEIRNGVPDGQGTSTSRYGWKYEGEWKNGNQNGWGEESFGAEESTSAFKYVGWFKDGDYWTGTITLKSGNIIGRYVNGKFIKQ